MNPRRVAAVLAVLAALIAVIVHSLGDDHAPPAGAAAAATSPAGGQPADPADAQDGPAGARPPASGPPSSAPADEGGDDALADPDAGAPTVPGNPAAVAAAFADAWTRHTGADAATWAHRLADMSSPELADLLRDVDPAVVPADRVTGPPVVASTDAWANAAVPTDAGTLQLTLFYSDRWIVTILDWSSAP